MTRICSLLCLWGILAGLWPQHLLAQSAPFDLSSYARVGEHVVTVQPALRLAGHTYTVHLFSTGEYDSASPGLFAVATEEYFQSRGITGLLIVEDGQRAVDEEGAVREILTLYASAYLLYERRPLENLGLVDDSFVEDLRKVTENPFFVEQQIKGLFSNRSDESAEALRGIITYQSPLPSTLTEYADALRAGAETASDMRYLIEDTLEAARFSNNRSVRRTASDIKTIFKSWRPITEQAQSYVEIGGERIEYFNALDVLGLSIRLVWLADLQQERADWLTEFAAFAINDARLDDDQQKAVNDVWREAEENWVQRGAIVHQFLREHAVEMGIRWGTQELAKRWVKMSWETFGKRTRGHLVAGAASAVLVGITISNLLYGLDDLYNNFQAGVRADELRHRFRAGRRQLESQARRQAGDFYDGELAGRFRIAYMLESLAAAQMYRVYADGVEATVQQNFLSLLNPVNWFKGKEWRDAAREMRQIANQIEGEAEGQVGHPEFLDAAIVLAAGRIPFRYQTLAEPDLAEGLNPITGWYARMEAWIAQTYQELADEIRARWEAFWREQWARLQEAARQMAAEMAQRAKEWWTDFLTDQGKKLERTVQDYLNELSQQICGGPALMLLGAVYVGLRRRKA